MNLNNSEKLFINKFQPLYFNDFEIKPELIEILKTYIDTIQVKEAINEQLR